MGVEWAGPDGQGGPQNRAPVSVALFARLDHVFHFLSAVCCGPGLVEGPGVGGLV